MIDEYGKTTLIDFGLAVIDEQHSQSQNEPIGTWSYMAPEGRDSLLALTPTSDVFSLAAALTFLAFGATPQEVKRLGLFGSDAWMGVAESLAPAWQRDFLTQCLCVDAVKRPTASEAFDALVAVELSEVEVFDGLVAERVGIFIAMRSNKDEHLIAAREWLKHAQVLAPDRPAEWLAKVVQQVDGIAASIPFWEIVAIQEPIGGNVTLFKRIQSNPDSTPLEKEAAMALLYKAADSSKASVQVGDRSSRWREERMGAWHKDRLGREFLKIGDYKSALEFLAKGFNSFPLIVLCHHRIGIQPPALVKSTHPEHWTSAAKWCEDHARPEDAEWLRSMASAIRKPVEGAMVE